MFSIYVLGCFLSYVLFRAVHALQSSVEKCKWKWQFPTTRYTGTATAVYAYALQKYSTNKMNSRPGVLVLINDADWELEGETSYVLQPNDNILFVSTLHGG